MEATYFNFCWASQGSSMGDSTHVSDFPIIMSLKASAVHHPPRTDQSERLRAEHSVRETHSSPSPTHQKVQSEIRFRREKNTTFVCFLSAWHSQSDNENDDISSGFTLQAFCSSF
ncbi:hypothetical protein SAY87_025864 [Trapa incisa]|uniref:Uncharacterized protein n=1 Tax=Trapa incisa TaxID=236973 RepID=A0AAN7JJU8_9MYRT|nr:hypothetical protein SAY87_025864 [Trapa incisa]